MNRYRLRRGSALFAALLLAPALAALAATSIQAGDFAWNARLELPTGASVARVELPVEALTRLQSTDAVDIRVFNASGDPVGFAVTGMTAPTGQEPPRHTPEYKTIPLFSSTSGKPPRAGSVRVHVNESGGKNVVWVQLEGPVSARPADAVATLPSAIVNTRSLQQTWSAITVQATLPANIPVRITADISTDLALWTPVSLRGRLYRFEGADGPRNDTLEFDSPLVLDKHYLRLSWYGQDGVQISAISGVLPVSRSPVQPARAALAPAQQVDKATLEWSLDFDTPLSALALTALQPNSLLPVRVSGRNDTTQAWRPLGQTVVYRLGADAAASINIPMPLASGPPVRQLRVQTSNGMALDASGIQASVELRPLQVVFVASGPGPFVVAAGRAQTPAAALKLSDILSALPGKIEELPLARLGEVTLHQPGSDGSWLGSIMANTNKRSWLLWAILVAGVLLLAWVAVKLVRQLNT